MEENPVQRKFEELLREYSSNAGMAGFVCGRPVELMPESEQKRIINGFCTKENLKILKSSIPRLQQGAQLDVTEAQKNRANEAVVTLEKLIEVIGAYAASSIKLAEMRERVRKILYKPIPETQEELIDSVSKLVEMVTFLSDQDLSTKDSWDRMLDCVQMHDVLSRALDVLTALQDVLKDKGSAIEESVTIANESISFLESFFKGETAPDVVPEHFKQLSQKFSALWSED